MRDEERRLCFSCGNQLTPFAIVSFHVSLAGAYMLAFYPKLANIDSDLALLCKLILGARILRDETVSTKLFIARFGVSWRLWSQP